MSTCEKFSPGSSRAVSLNSGFFSPIALECAAVQNTSVATSCSGSIPPTSSDEEPHALRALLSSYARHLRSLQVLQVAGWHALETCRLKCEQRATKSRLGHKKATPPTCILSTLPQPRRRPQRDRRTSPPRLRPHAVNERLDCCDLDSDDDGLEPLPISESGVRRTVCGKKITKTLRARVRCARAKEGEPRPHAVAPPPLPSRRPSPHAP